MLVSVAELRCTKAPQAILATVGLGSCLGVTCYDPKLKIGGLLHAMLPDSQRRQFADPNSAMYLDTGLASLLAAMGRLGADATRLECYVVGAAQTLGANEFFSIGQQNIEAMNQLAEQHRLHIKRWEVGGQLNRSIELHLDTGGVLMRAPNRPEAWL